MSSNLIKLLVKIFSWVLMGLSVAIALLFFTGTATEELFIVWAYILVAIAAVLAVLFPIAFFISNPKNGLKALMGIVLVGIVFVIAYSMADATPIVTTTSSEIEAFSNPGTLRLADTGILATYILFGVAVVSLLFTGLRSIFNR